MSHLLVPKPQKSLCKSGGQKCDLVKHVYTKSNRQHLLLCNLYYTVAPLKVWTSHNTLGVTLTPVFLQCPCQLFPMMHRENRLPDVIAIFCSVKTIWKCLVLDVSLSCYINSSRGQYKNIISAFIFNF